jgi:translation initiation factor IF-2
MGKIRVYEIAEKIGLTTDQLIARLKRLGIDVHSNLSAVDEAVARPLLAASEKLRESATKEAAKEAARERAKQVSKKKTKPAQSAATRKQLRKARAAKARQFTEEYEKREADELARRRAQKEHEDAEKARRRKEEEERQRALEVEQKRLEAEAARRRQAEAEVRRAEQEALRKRAAEEAARRQIEAEEAAARERAAEESARDATRRVAADIEEMAPAPAPRAWSPPPPRPRPPRPAGRPRGKAPSKGKAARDRMQPAVAPPPPRPAGPPREIALSEGVTVKELAEKMEVKSRDIMRVLVLKGVMATINQPLEPEVAKDVAREFNFNAEILSFEEEAQRKIHKPEMTGEGLQPRPPVVTIMGHVDHGKTSLLDAIRESNLIASEAGGITQHIGAYHVEVNGRKITFLDTPGHEAFTRMRSRGAQVTDIVVLVVAADDGVMPQTREAIDHARAAGVPILVAVNKIDKPGAKPDVVRKQLADLGLIAEEWGGQTVFCQVSAKQRTGLDHLLEMILLVADLAELRADPTAPAFGTILEARLDRARGAVASVLVQNGALRVGDPFIAGTISGKVRAMFDEYGSRIDAVGPGMPAEIAGLDGIPQAGDSMQVVDEERRARAMMSLRQSRLREEQLRRGARPSLDRLFQQIEDGKIKELPIILKCDVQGSVEVLHKSIQDLGSDQVKVRILHAAIGAITESDILLASSSGAIVVGFHVRPERGARELAEKEAVDIRLYDVIYQVTEEIRAAMLGLLEPTLREDFLGRAEVRETFKIPRAGMIAGCYIVEGRVPAGAEVRLLRDNTVVYEGRISSLKRFKDDAAEVREGFECGIGLERFHDLKKGDVIEAYRIEKVAPQAL